MENQKSIKKNFIMNTILKMSAFIFPLITFPYASRMLLPEGMGKVAFAASVVSYFSMFASMGIPTYGIRACAKVRNDKEKLSKVVHEIFILNMITLMVTYIAFFAFIISVDKMNSYLPLLLLNSISLIFNVFGMEWLYCALEEYSYISIRSLVFKVIGIGLLFVLVHGEEDYIIYAFITMFASVGSNILNLINIRKYVSLTWIGNYKIRKHIKPTMILFATSIAINVYTNLDTLMLGYMTSDVEVGLYITAVKFKQILTSLILSLGMVLLPRISYYYERNESEKINDLLVKSAHFTLILSLGLSAFFILYSRESILFLAGNNYLGAVLPMKIIIATIPFIGLANIVAYQILIPTNNERGYLFATCVGAIIDLVLNYIFIPTMGASGAAIGTLGAAIGEVIILYYLSRKVLNKLFKNIPYYFSIVSLATAVFVTIIFRPYIQFSSLINLILGAVIFFGTYLITLVVMKEPILSDTIESLKKYLYIN